MKLKWDMARMTEISGDVPVQFFQGIKTTAVMLDLFIESMIIKLVTAALRLRAHAKAFNLLVGGGAT